MAIVWGAGAGAVVHPRLCSDLCGARRADVPVRCLISVHTRVETGRRARWQKPLGPGPGQRSSSTCLQKQLRGTRRNPTV